MYQRHIKQLEQFPTPPLRSILGLRWRTRSPMLRSWTEPRQHALKRCSSKPSFVGRDTSGQEHCMPRQLLRGELVSGKRRQGRRRWRFKDSLEENLKLCDIKPAVLKSAALERSIWRSLSRRAATKFEEERCQRLTAACEQRHRAASVTTVAEQRSSSVPTTFDYVRPAGTADPPQCPLMRPKHHRLRRPPKDHHHKHNLYTQAWST